MDIFVIFNSPSQKSESDEVNQASNRGAGWSFQPGLHWSKQPGHLCERMSVRVWVCKSEVWLVSSVDIKWLTSKRAFVGYTIHVCVYVCVAVRVYTVYVHMYASQTKHLCRINPLWTCSQSSAAFQITVREMRWPEARGGETATVHLVIECSCAAWLHACLLYTHVLGKGGKNIWANSFLLLRNHRGQRSSRPELQHRLNESIEDS